MIEEVLSTDFNMFFKNKYFQKGSLKAKLK